MKLSTCLHQFFGNYLPHIKGVSGHTIQAYRDGEDLLEAVLRLRPRLHVFGHIHEAYGQVERDGVQFVNASICTLAYEPSNAPICIDLPARGASWRR